MWNYLGRFLAFLWGGGLIISYIGGIVADPKKENLSEKRKKIGNVMINAGLFMFYSSIILLLGSAWYYNK